MANFSRIGLIDEVLGMAFADGMKYINSMINPPDHPKWHKFVKLFRCAIDHVSMIHSKQNQKPMHANMQTCKHANIQRSIRGPYWSA